MDSPAPDVLFEVRLSTRSTTTVNLLDLPLADARQEFERVYFRELLDKHQGSVRAVSAHCGVERTHVYRKLQMLGLRERRNDPPAPGQVENVDWTEVVAWRESFDPPPQEHEP